jgi:hypothetical protein
MNQNTQIKKVLRQVALALLESFEARQADPLLVDEVSRAMEGIVREHVQQQGPGPGVRGRLRLEQLLDELDGERRDEEQQ